MRANFATTVWLACLLALTFVSQSQASTKRPLPLARFSHATDVQFELVRRGDESSSLEARHRSISGATKRSIGGGAVEAADALRLSLRAFGQTFHLHLEPNENLVHPNGATVKYWGHDEQGRDVVVREEKIMPGETRAYHGHVVHPFWTRDRIVEDRVGLRRDLNEPSWTDMGVMGPASIVVHDDGSESGTPKFEGSFTWEGNQHYIQLPESYESSRTEHDPRVSKRSLESGHLVVHRDSDIMQPHEARALGVRDVVHASKGCSSDSHEYNLNNPLIYSATNNNADTWMPMSFFAVPPSGVSAVRRATNALFDTADLLSRSPQPELVGAPELSERFQYHDPLQRRQRGGGDILTGNGGSNVSYVNSIGSTSGCPTQNKVVYVGMASDCTYTGRFQDQDAARRALLSNINDVSNIYRTTFRVAIGVVQLEVRSATCPATPPADAQWNVACGSDTLDSRLSTFSRWRGNQQDKSIGLWHLMTNCNTGSEVGVAWLGTLCKTDASGSGGDVISGTGVTSSTMREAQVVAHEMGHNFGAIHDCASGCSLQGQIAVQNGGATCCPQSASTCSDGGQHIMSPVSQTSTTTFSACSIGNICSLLGRGLDTSCVVDPGQRETLSDQQCGNGILEPGEECDAGTQGSACCTSECRLTSGSACDPSTAACCTDQCQIASAGTTCRPAIDNRCDQAETCTGTNSTCPADVRSNDGASCGDGLSCAAGVCTSRDLQCQQQGRDLGLTEACSQSADNSCSVTCQNPNSFNSCIILQQNFIDGTSCGYGGRCDGGQCRKGSWQDTFKGWYENNLRIAIPVTILIAIIVLAILYGLLRCILNACRGGGRGSKRAASGAYAGNNRRSHRSQQSQQANMPPPPQHPQGYYGQGNDGQGYYQGVGMQQQQHYDSYAPPTQAPPSAYGGNQYSNGYGR